MNASRRRTWRTPLILAVLTVFVSLLPPSAIAGGIHRGAPSAASVQAAGLPTGFTEQTVISGLQVPTGVEFASDGRIFVAEKSGIIKVFDSLTDPTPTVFADLRTNVYDFFDRGLLGLALAPGFPANPWVYVLYTYDAPIGGTAPTWNDDCPTPPGATADGCVASARLSRLQASGNVMTGQEQVLISDWCQQFPSHSVGDIEFGPDGALYAGGGDAASFNFVDYGQEGSPVNPCGDPGGASPTPPTAEGGALRSQDLRTTGDPTGLDGSIIRIDPATGAALPDNPGFGTGDANSQRIVTYGLRNPFRFTFRPGTNELWIGDVGWNSFEEINRITNPTNSVTNFGWPCYEGFGRQSAYDGTNLNVCEQLYVTPGGARNPYYTYTHHQPVVAGDTCDPGSSDITGLAFYPGGDYPSQYDGALFFSDYSRDCLWVMFPGGNGLPDPTNVMMFDDAANPVELEIGPDGDLYYVNIEQGQIRRYDFAGGNQPPVGVVTADPTGGPTAPLLVNFDGSSSFDPEGGALTYEWDLNGDGAFDDATGPQASWTYSTQGPHVASLRVTDPALNSDVESVTIAVGNPPVPTITTPSASTTWVANQQISFSGTASDVEDGQQMPGSALSWELLLHHCPDSCHEHFLATYSGLSGLFTAPDHEYPSYLELRLTATDSSGLSTTTSVVLNPQTVGLTFQSLPTGLQIVAGSASQATPFTQTVIVGSSNPVTATSPQSIGQTTYTFSSWSDGGMQTHTIIAGSTPATYTATFTTPPVGVVVSDFAFTPDRIRVSPGTTVQWTFNGPSNHTVTERRALFDSGVKSPGSTFSYTFTTVGSFSYRCTIHPAMRGRVVVR
jgi:glucose/arabinose dehydrogenase/plastocyanin